VTSDEGPRGKIRPQKGRGAIAALLTQKNIEEAARSIGIGHATLLRWLKESEFDTAYREARRAAFRQSVARLQQASGAAVTTLLKLMLDPPRPGRPRHGLPTASWTIRPRRFSSKTSKRGSRS
jgi:hypothetical protein